jgi:ATP-dependent DNA helicase PIF1
LLSESTDIKPRKIRYYAVAIGRKTGVYRDWPSAEKQINGYHNAKHKKFKTEEEAMAYVDKYKHVIQRLSTMPPGRDMSALSMHGYEQYSLSMQASRPTSQRSFDSGYCFNDTCYEPVSHKPPSTQTRMLDLSQERVLLDDSPKPILDDEPRLVPEQQQVVDLIVQGHNVFYTGSAGCGKSTILKAFVRQLQQRGKRVKIVAPTNLAALNVGGQTTWNFAGWTPDSMKIRIDKLMENSRGKESWKKFDETDVLVIDEISMIENLQFERLNRILKASRGEKYGGGAFGGVQLVVTGDVSSPSTYSSSSD